MKIKEPKVLWLVVTPDKYELPIMVCDSQKELAEKLKISVSNISHLLHRERRSNKKCKYYIYKVRCT